MLLPCLLVFLLLNHYTPIIYSVPFYQPIEDYVILCGSSSNPDISTNKNGNRSYTGDSNSNNSDLYFSLLDYSSSSVISSPSFFPPSVFPSDLYRSARLSNSEFTYSFLLSHGPKFLRLHFFPASYSNFQSYNAVFSVKSNNFTLLKDFNASLVAGEGGTVSREYCIHIEPGESLNVTFTPSNNTTTSANAYAFINAIEIVSMPDYLYFTNSSSKESLRLLGQLNDDDFPIEFTTAMQLKYRINVGGTTTGPDEDDTGMSRPWLDDNDFLKQVTPRSLPHDVATPLNYSIIPNYTALSEIYRNGRSYGQGQNTTLHNVTWEFEVVSGFDYLVRLHFCEVDPAVNETEDRVFQIFVAESLAEEHADVFLWTGGRMVPYYKEYAVSLLQGRSDDPRVNLSIKLQPHPDINVRRYDDVILNGIEIFKLSDFSNSLAEPNYPENPREPDSSPNNNNHHSSINEPSKPSMLLRVVIGSSVTGFIVVVLVIVIGLVFRQRRVKQNKKGDHDHSKHSTSLPSDLCRCFSIAEIKEATNNFDDVFQVGVGGFGHVYKGYIDNRTIPVAIKRLKPGSQQGAHEFLTEIEMLSQLRHLHLVSLIGYCNDDNEMILVYEFMARGTLRDHLYGSDDNQPLSWKQRLEICLGAARGLSYLHTGAKHNIIHRDVKSTNILIDEKWVAKVSDFGLSKVGPTGMSRSHVSTVVKGSVGYLDPEYYKRQRLTQKSDVYSFGVVLLEVLCGRPSLDRTVEKQKASLVGWVRKCYQEGMIHETIDPLVIESITPECLKAFSAMALKCLVDDGNERPSMNDVVWGLEFALELQETKVEDNKEITLSSSRKDVIIEQKSDEMGFSSSETTTTTGRGSDESSSSKMTMSDPVMKSKLWLLP